MRISEQELLVESSRTGFRPEILEKVWHLMALLDGINTHPFLKEKLVLKGGTALNLFVFGLPRLSVDIDLNYVGEVDRDRMFLERPQIEKALESVFQREQMMIRRIPEKHAGGKWQLRYESAFGGSGNLEVDLNFMFRVPLSPITKQASHAIGNRQTREIALLDTHELGAGKLAALFGRHASRDLFDTHELLTKCSLDLEQLRLLSVVYGAMGAKDWREVSIDDVQFNRKELQLQLIPVLRRSVVSQMDWSVWANQLLADSRNALKSLLPLRENEIEFLRQLFDRGVLDGSLITTNSDMIERINAHPLLNWKIKNLKTAR